MAGEACDDGGTTAGDGCDGACGIEAGFSCTGSPSVCTPGCGDGNQSGSEACDDGNNAEGDCCSSTCQVEAGCEVEPNDTPPEANDFDSLSVFGRINGFINPGLEHDFFSITVPAGTQARLRAETVDGFNGSSCVGLTLDSNITITDANGDLLGSNDDINDDDYCSLVNVGGLQPGEYFIDLQISDFADPDPFDYTLELQLDFTVCGNNVLEDGEVCDDGNTMDGDGCSALCKLDVATPEIEPNKDPFDADTNGPYLPNVLITGTIMPIGDVDYFAITVPAFADIKIETFDPGSQSTCAAVDTEVTLFDVDGTSVLASDDDTGLEACSLIEPETSNSAHLPAGTYYVRVEEFSNDATLAGYNLLITFEALCGDNVTEGGEECDGGVDCDADCNRIPMCGDGSIDGAETCDDGNTTPLDGCNAFCQLEGLVPETEPNDTTVDADTNGPFTPDVFISGSIGAPGDLDYFAINLTGVADITVETFDATGPFSCNGVDTVLQLIDTDGVTLLEEDDEGGVDSCSLLDSAATVQLPAGTYYVRVEDYFGGVIDGYVLDVRVVALCGDGAVSGSEECDGGATCNPDCTRLQTCGDGFIDGTETCDDSNTMDSDGCSSGCQLEGVTPETEPNQTPAEADVIGPFTPELLFTGSIPTFTDADVFALNLTSAADLKIETFGASGPVLCNAETDTSVQLLAADGTTVIIEDDDDGPGPCSRIDSTLAPDAAARHLLPGIYYVRVTSFNNETLIPGYTLRITYNALCGDNVTEGSEECDDGGTVPGDGCDGVCEME